MSLARLACVQRACRACCARVCSCARRRAVSAGHARTRRSPVRDMPNCALATLFCAVQNALRAYSFVGNRRRGICCTAARTHRCCQLLTRPCAFLPMPSNPRKHKLRAIYNNDTRRCAEQACEHVLETAEQTQCLLPELASHLERHNWCVTTSALNDHASCSCTRSTRFILHVCARSQWLCSEVSCAHSRAASRASDARCRRRRG